MIENKKTQHSEKHKPAIITLFLLFLLLVIIVSPGCLKLMQEAGSNKDAQESAITSIAPTGEQTVTGSADGPPVQIEPPPLTRYDRTTTLSVPANSMSAGSAPAKTPDIVTEDLPELTPDPYPVQHATVINTTTSLSLRHVRIANFQKTYVFRGNSTGLLVNATMLDGPLWISFDIDPLFDCLNDSESCRGEPGKSVSRPYFKLTVRDNSTRTIVAEDGYGREYSSQKDNRTIKIYGEGWYHLTLTGNSVDVDLAVSTGTIPVASEPGAAATPTQAGTIPPEVLRHLGV
jgi:hypothetical protein